MTPELFEQRIKIHNVRSATMVAAARLVLIGGKGQREACRMIGTTSGQLSPIVQKLKLDTCPCCGQQI